MKQVFYSEKLNKYYDSEKECKEAEAAFEDAENEKLKAKEKRADDAKEVEDAYKAYLQVKKDNAEVIKKANADINSAFQTYLDKRQEFINKYGSYHMTYTNRNGIEDISFDGIVDSIINNFLRL